MRIDVSTLTTPTLLIDQRICKRNITRMVHRSRSAGLRLRPHMKTAQSRRIARYFLEQGVDAITTSSVGMARYFIDDGWMDVCIAFPFNIREIDAVNDIDEGVDVHLVVESTDTAAALGKRLRRPVRIWIKVDTGHGRTGIPYDDARSLDDVMSMVERTTQLTLQGVLTHAGMTYSARSTDEIRNLFSLSRERLVRAAQQHGERLETSTGDTPGCVLTESFDGLNEIRPGNFMFFDVMQHKLGVCRSSDIAIAVACPVVALHRKRGEVILYGGAIHFSKDSIPAADGGPVFGLVCEMAPEGWSEPIPDAYVRALSQEHGIVRAPEALLARLKPGDLLAVLPIHSCLTAQAMGSYVALDGSGIDHYAGMRKV